MPIYDAPTTDVQVHHMNWVEEQRFLRHTLEYNKAMNGTVIKLCVISLAKIQAPIELRGTVSTKVDCMLSVRWLVTS